MHLADPEQRHWWQLRLESTRAKATLDAGDKRHILQRLTAAEGLEKYRLVEDPLALRYMGPPDSASTAPGYGWMHVARQEAFLKAAIDE